MNILKRGKSIILKTKDVKKIKLMENKGSDFVEFSNTCFLLFLFN